jgi:predicted PurR-regulated permease PerM
MEPTPSSTVTPVPSPAPLPPATAPTGAGFPGPPAGVRERRSRHIGWRSRDIIRGTLLVLAVFYLLKLLWLANQLVAIVFLGTLFGLAVSRGVDYLERFRIRRGIASALIVFGTIAALVGIGMAMAPTLREQGAVLRRQLPTAVDRVEEWVNTRRGFMGLVLGGSEVARQQPVAAAQGGAGASQPRGGGAAPVPAAGGAQQPGRTGAAQPARPGGADSSALASAAPGATLRARIGQALTGATRYLFPFLSSTAAALAGIVIVIFLAVYVGAEPKLYHDGLMHLFPHRARKRAGEVLSEMAIVLRKWLVTQLIAMAAIGTITTVVLLILDVKAAFALGLIAGLLEFVPTVGPILSAIPAIAMGFVDSPEKALYVVLAYWGIQFLENNLLIPFLMRGGIDLPPAVTIIAQSLMTIVFGFLGLMVAVPLTAAIMVPIKMLYVEDVVGDQINVRDGGDEDDD